MMEHLDQLDDIAAREAAATYLTDLERCLAERRKPVRKDVRAGVEAHLLEALDHDASTDVAKLNAALKALGDPIEFADDWADAVELRYPREPLETASSFVRTHVLLMGQIALTCLCVLGGLAGLAGFVGRLVDPDSVGVFRLADGEVFIGTWTSYYAAIEQDMLGAMTAPISLLLAVTFFAIAWVARPTATKK